MGLAASQARLLMLTARKSDLEFRLQQINQSRMRLANSMMTLFPVLTGSEPDSPQVVRAQEMSKLVQQQDKLLELHANQISTQHQAVSTELDAVQKIISKNIQSSFGLLGRG